VVIINFPDGSDWYKANWTFRQICEDAIVRFPGASELKESLEMAQAYGRLSLDHEEQMRRRTADALRIVARETIAGKIKGWAGAHPEDLDGQEQYLGTIRELLGLLEQPGNQSATQR
jgi:hypothetical protein